MVFNNTRMADWYKLIPAKDKHICDQQTLVSSLGSSTCDFNACLFPLGKGLNLQEKYFFLIIHLGNTKEYLFIFILVRHRKTTEKLQETYRTF